MNITAGTEAASGDGAELASISSAGATAQIRVPENQRDDQEASNANGATV